MDVTPLRLYEDAPVRQELRQMIAILLDPSPQPPDLVRDRPLVCIILARLRIRRQCLGIPMRAALLDRMQPHEPDDLVRVLRSVLHFAGSENETTSFSPALHVDCAELLKVGMARAEAMFSENTERAQH
jgi:hypothetical protein